MCLTHTHSLTLARALSHTLTHSRAQVLLVSSGAVGLGRLRLGLSKDVVSDPANVVDRQVLPKPYRGTSLIRNTPLLGPYSSICLGPYGGPRGGGGFL